MKEITIKKESSWTINETMGNGFSISWDDREKEATIFELSEDECSKLIPKEPIVQFWNKLNEINFQKVLLENEQYQGLDGSYSIIELSVGLHSLRLDLWCPSLEFYKEYNMDESLKLLMIINNIVKFAADNNVAKDFDF